MEKKTIGGFIAALRKANGMTQQELADKLNISNKAVSRWERDECAPDIALIPAIAEIFGVTCDELLKGERIFTQTEPVRSEPKIDKQIKALINRSLSRFRTMIWIALALAAVGLVCMLGISYGFYRPIVGFAVMMLFEVAAFAVTAIAVSKMKETKNDNELFESANDSIVAKFNSVLGKLSYIAFFASVAVVLLSLPLALVTSDYVESVLPASTYFLYFFISIALVLALAFVAFKARYIAWITEQPYEKAGKPVNPLLRRMNILQLGATALVGLLFVVLPWFDTPTGEEPLIWWILSYVILALMIANIIVFAVFIIRASSERKGLILPGIRNILMLLPAIRLSGFHSPAFTFYGSETVEIGLDGSSAIVEPQNQYWTRESIWNPEFLLIAAGLAIVIAALFGLIEILIRKRKMKTKQK